MSEDGVAPWAGSFEVAGDASGKIVLEQLDAKRFALGSTLTYIGDETGLESKVPPATLVRIRSVSPQTLPVTDLASVPGVLRWFAGRYGVHTPAALIHDWLIPQPVDPPLEGMTNEYADRYFRYMLGDLGVPMIRRWLMWAATAARSRFTSSRLNAVLLGVWLTASVTGMIVFTAAVLTGEVRALLAATLAPIIFAGLWGRQYGAGIVAAYSAPWILPPTIFALAGHVVYLAVEWLLGWLTDARR